MGVLILRIGLIFCLLSPGLYPEFDWLKSNRVIRSLIVRPKETLDFVSGIHAREQLSAGHDSVADDKIWTDMKPLEYAMLSAIAMSSSPYILAALLLFLDVSVGLLLEQVGNELIQNEDQDYEEEMQKNIPEAIQAERLYLFATTKIDQASIQRHFFPLLASQLYFCSPLSVASSGVYGSLQSLLYVTVLWAIHQSTHKRGSVAQVAFSLALACYLSVFLGALLIPCGLLIERRGKSLPLLTILFLFWVLSLHGLSFLLVGDKYWNVEYDFPVFSHPNLGILWYFTMQVFGQFRAYFAIMFAGIPYTLIVPLLIRLHRYPLVLGTAYWGLFALFHNHPTMLELNLAVSLMVLSPRSLARTGLPTLIAICAMPVPLALYVMDCWLWLETGSGNANYIYFQCMAYQVFSAFLFLDFCGASIRRDKALRLTEKYQVLAESGKRT